MFITPDVSIGTINSTVGANVDVSGNVLITMRPGDSRRHALFGNPQRRHDGVPIFPSAHEGRETRALLWRELHTLRRRLRLRRIRDRRRFRCLRARVSGRVLGQDVRPDIFNVERVASRFLAIASDRRLRVPATVTGRLKLKN